MIVSPTIFETLFFNLGSSLLRQPSFKKIMQDLFSSFLYRCGAATALGIIQPAAAFLLSFRSFLGQDRNTNIRKHQKGRPRHANCQQHVWSAAKKNRVGSTIVKTPDSVFSSLYSDKVKK